MVGDLVTHDLHDVVSISDETKADGQGNNSNLPQLDGDLGLAGLAGAPGRVHGGPDTDSVTDIVGTVGERGSAGSDDLDKAVEMLDFIGVLCGVGVDTVHATSLRSSENTDLGLVDVVVYTVEHSDDSHGWEADTHGLEVVEFVDGAGAHGVLVESAHGPAEGTLLLAEIGVVTGTGFGEEDLVVGLGVLGEGKVALGVDVATTKSGVGVSGGSDVLLVGLLRLASLGRPLGVKRLRVVH